MKLPTWAEAMRRMHDEEPDDGQCGHVNGLMRELGDPDRPRCALKAGHVSPHANKYGDEV
jgi:hypothetical protein